MPISKKPRSKTVVKTSPKARAPAALPDRRAVESFLFEVRGFDPVTYGWLMAFMIITALLATYIPARLAKRIDPMAVLRCE